MNVQNVIDNLGLAPHPEGGYYRRTYQCERMLIPQEMPCCFDQPRPVSTAILFLLRAGQYSRLHRIRQDELWHFHLGGPLRLVWIERGGHARETIMGPDILNGHVLQCAVPGGCWFGATPAPGADFSLVGCTVAPGFDFSDLRLGQRSELESRYPLALDCIREFCPCEPLKEPRAPNACGCAPGDARSRPLPHELDALDMCGCIEASDSCHAQKCVAPPKGDPA